MSDKETKINAYLDNAIVFLYNAEILIDKDYQKEIILETIDILKTFKTKEEEH